MYKFMLLAGLCLFFSFGCKNRSGNEVVSKDEAVSVDSECRAISAGSKGPMGPVSELNASIAGDCLVLDLKFGGGCKEHDFDLLWNGAWMKSMPPQVSLKLSHNSNQDHCRAMLSEKISFNLKDLKMPGQDQLTIHLSAKGQERKTLNHRFKQ